MWFVSRQGVESSLTNKVRDKETKEQMHSRNIRFGWDSNQGLPDEKPVALQLS